ncbi:MAG: alpha/beta hydrolase [Flavobacterium sp.]|uniref:alpha/beta hydrolase n=1 Tax=Flavobacterium sp. TaxID=239 RepID=UPI001211BFCA|nr:alpha/beta hydrolase [Flavobacterium sp.]RZJ68315.1 MAG: alpha/beta hydrolase [Flavobacterium sp.]
MKTIASNTVVFITGAFVTHNGWNPWKDYFESKGYVTYNPAWPHKNGTAQELRALAPNDVALAELTLTELVDHYAEFVKQLPEKPIIIGHSLGGMVTQILVNRGLAAAGIAIHSIPPQPVIPYEFSFLKAGYKVLGLFTSLKKTYTMSLSDWQYAFTNGMTLEEQQQSWEENVIPESKTVARGGLTSAAKIDFKKPHVPLLLISGSTDNITPASMNLRNFRAYKTPDSVTDYKEFAGKNHFVLGLPTWHEEADYILDWIERN